MRRRMGEGSASGVDQGRGPRDGRFRKAGRRRAFIIAQRFQQRAYDCLYVALAEQQGVEFWTGDRRLYNALPTHYVFVQWIGDYQRQRPEEGENAANGLASGDCGLSDDSVAGDWRLPNVKKLQSLIDFRFYGPALSNAARTDKWTDGDAFSGVPSGVQSTYYWSSTTSADHPDYAWRVSLIVGGTHANDKDTSFFVWPVRGVQGGYPPCHATFFGGGPW
jgi:hypothetical protein